MECFIAIAFGFVAGITFLLLASLIVGLDDETDELANEREDREYFIGKD